MFACIHHQPIMGRPAFAATLTDTLTAANDSSPSWASVNIGSASAWKWAYLAIGFNDTGESFAAVDDDIATANITVLLGGVTCEILRLKASGGSGRGYVIARAKTNQTGDVAVSVSWPDLPAGTEHWAGAVFQVIGHAANDVRTRNGSDDVSIDTDGYDFVMLASGDSGQAPGAYSGGNAVLSVASGESGAGHDPSPAGALTTYDATNDTDAFGAAAIRGA